MSATNRNLRALVAALFIMTTLLVLLLLRHPKVITVTPAAGSTDSTAAATATVDSTVDATKPKVTNRRQTHNTGRTARTKTQETPELSPSLIEVEQY